MAAPMTGVTWLVATQAPRALAPHPNFTAESVTPESVLALISDYRLDEVERFRKKVQADLPGWAVRLLDGAYGSLWSPDQRAATDDLWQLALSRDLPCGARAAAALFAAVGSTEMDEPEIASEHLARLVDELDIVSNSRSEDLILLSLKLQWAVRLYECDRTDEALEIAQSLRRAPSARRGEDGQFDAFEVSPGISWNSRRVQQDIASAARRHAQALVSRVESLRGRAWIKVVRARPGWIDGQIDNKTARRGQALLKNVFEQTVASVSNTRRLGGGDVAIRAGLAALLMAELNGDTNEIFRNREALGCLRVVREEGDASSMQEAIRLLRTSGVTDSYTSALRYIRSNGPNAALLNAAEVVLARPSFQHRVEQSDLVLLSHASDLLQVEQLRAGLSAVWTFLQRVADGPPAGWKPIEQAWRAIARLVRESGQDDEVARQALALLRSDDFGLPLVDVIRTALGALDWSHVSESTKGSIVNWAMENSEEDHDELALEILAILKGRPSTIDQRHSGLMLAAKVANALHSDAPPGASQVKQAVVQCIEAMSKVRANAQRQSATVGILDAGDVSAALAIVLSEEKLWWNLGELLADELVFPFQKRLALDRMAASPEAVPSFVVEKLRERWNHILQNVPTESPFEGTYELPHFPEAIRAGAALGLMERKPVLVAVTELAAGTLPASRIEASRTIPAAVRRYGAADWGHVLLLQLTHDRDPAVRGEAGRALASVADVESSMSAIVTDRLVDLLKAEGIQAPLFTLHGLQDAAQGGRSLPGALQEAGSLMAVDHPARVVRKAAALFSNLLPG